MHIYKRIDNRPTGKVFHEKVRKIKVEYLYLDLNTCERCVGTEDILADVVLKLTPALELAGYKITYEKKEMTDAQTATEYRFLSSPTVRVNGRDVNTEVRENSCGCCSDISGCDVDCRVFELDGKSYEVPPEAVLADALLRSIFGPPKRAMTRREYQLPENLVTFYAGKESKAKQ